MQDCFFSCSDEGRQGLAAVKQVNDVAVSLHREGARHEEEVSEEAAPVQQQVRLDGSEQLLERGDQLVASGSMSSELPGEEDRTEERQPCAVLSGVEQPVDVEEVSAHSYGSHTS